MERAGTRDISTDSVESRTGRVFLGQLARGRRRSGRIKLLPGPVTVLLLWAAMAVFCRAQTEPIGARPSTPATSTPSTETLRAPGQQSRPGATPQASQTERAASPDQ